MILEDSIVKTIMAFYTMEEELLVRQYGLDSSSNVFSPFSILNLGFRSTNKKEEVISVINKVNKICKTNLSISKGGKFYFVKVNRSESEKIEEIANKIKSSRALSFSCNSIFNILDEKKLKEPDSDPLEIFHNLNPLNDLMLDLFIRAGKNSLCFETQNIYCDNEFECEEEMRKLREKYAELKEFIYYGEDELEMIKYDDYSHKYDYVYAEFAYFNYKTGESESYVILNREKMEEWCTKSLKDILHQLDEVSKTVNYNFTDNEEEDGDVNTRD